MKIFLLEYITAGGFNTQEIPQSLLTEAYLMRDALLCDFSGLDDLSLEIVTTYDARLENPILAASATPIFATDCVESIWQKQLADCDAALVVAPETAGILTHLTQLIESQSVHNLGCSSQAVQLTSDKLQTYHALIKAQILTIPSYLATDTHIPFVKETAYIVKPIDGAGCDDTLLFDDAEALQRWISAQQKLAESSSDNHLVQKIIQPYIQGQAASFSMLCKAGKAWLLSCNAQTIQLHAQGEYSALSYAGSSVNAFTQYYDAFSALANQIVANIPGLNGYVGVDVIIQDAAIYVVEINPRITTSYVGLHQSNKQNPARLLLDLANKNAFSLPDITHLTKQPSVVDVTL